MNKRQPTLILASATITEDDNFRDVLFSQVLKHIVSHEFGESRVMAKIIGQEHLVVFDNMTALWLWTAVLE